MSTYENENYNQEDLYFQDDETRYKDDVLDPPFPEDQPINNHSESNYGKNIKGGTGNQKSENDDLEDEENDNELDNLRVDRPL